MADDKVPPIPYKTPMLDRNGLLTGMWAVWFRQIFLLVGTGVATTGGASTTTITNVTQSVSTLRDDVNGLLQGPDL